MFLWRRLFVHLFVFEMESCYIVQAGQSDPISTSQIAGITGMLHHAQLHVHCACGLFNCQVLIDL
jgi:hypothetical protein